MAYPKCNCIHINSDGTYPPGNGSISNPYIHEKYDDDCLLYPNGDVVIPDENGCIILPTFPGFNGVETDEGVLLEKINGCYRLPFPLPDEEHWQFEPPYSIIDSIRLEDEATNTGIVDYVDNELEITLSELIQIPEVEDNLIKIPQLNLSQDKLNNYASTSMVEETIPLDLYINHLSERKVLIKVILTFLTDGIIDLTPLILFHNSEIPLSPVEEIPLPSLEINHNNSFTFYKMLDFTNENMTSTHTVSLKLRYNNFSATTLTIESGTLSAILL